LAARQTLGADIDLAEAYAWGWDVLGRIEAEMAREADRIRAGASVDEAVALLDETQWVAGSDAYQAWLQERHDWALEQLHGTHFDIAEPLRTIEVTLARGSTSGAAYYTPPSEDLTRPGRTWWPLGGRERFATWTELTTVFHLAGGPRRGEAAARLRSQALAHRRPRPRPDRPRRPDRVASPDRPTTARRTASTGSRPSGGLGRGGAGSGWRSPITVNYRVSRPSTCPWP
jgi:hypothetical protein